MGRVISIFLFLVIFCSEPSFAGVIKGKVSTAKLKAPKDIVVYIDKIEGKELSSSGEPAKMDQIKLVFIPYVLPIIKGTTVEFHNSDDVKHNVFAVGTENFDLGTWTKGITKSYTFNKLGDTAILCNVHPEMEAYVFVLQNPYFAITDENGQYQIKDVPSGSYKLKAWHNRLKPVTKDVDVAASGELTVDFGLK